MNESRKREKWYRGRRDEGGELGGRRGHLHRRMRREKEGGEIVPKERERRGRDGLWIESRWGEEREDL